MVGGTPKPFACTHEGCTMTFTNEDHLNVHQKKHEMDLNLNLGNKTNVFVADQTPTPTRFLRNCEEVGLFQDLQNVNPFEETFRRAVELVKTGSLPEPDLPTDDTLHTPHVFPLLTEESNLYTSQVCQELATRTTKSIPNDSVLSRDLDLSKIDNQDIFENSSATKEKSADVLDYKIKHNTHISDSIDHDYALEISEHRSNVNEIVDSSHTPTKLKLKQILLKNKKQSLTVNVNQDKPAAQTVYLAPINVPHKIITSVSAAHSANSNIISIIAPNSVKTPSVSSAATDVNETEPTGARRTNASARNHRSKESLKVSSNREEILERNRAAASRCREKKKKWVSNLENNYEKVCRHNNELQKEVVNLRNEVVQLKTLLLAHKDCSVTNAMNMGEKFVIDPSQILSVQFTQNNNSFNKKRLVLPKADPPTDMASKVKIQKLTPTTIGVKDISFVTAQSKKSVIVLNTAYSDLANN